MQSQQKWTKEDASRLFEEASNPKGETRIKVFRRLAKELGRSEKALERKFYKQLRAKSPATKNATMLRKPKKRAVKQDRFEWTKEKLDIVKEELLKVSNKPNATFNELYEKLAERFNYSKGTIFVKMKAIKALTNTKTFSSLYNALMTGLSPEFFNTLPNKTGRKSRKKRRMKKREIAVVVAPKVEVAPKMVETKKEQVKVQDFVKQEIMQKPSFWQMINPFYSFKVRINKLEQEVRDLKSKLQ